MAKGTSPRARQAEIDKRWPEVLETVERVRCLAEAGRQLGISPTGLRSVLKRHGRDPADYVGGPAVAPGPPAGGPPASPERVDRGNYGNGGKPGGNYGDSGSSGKSSQAAVTSPRAPLAPAPRPIAATTSIADRCAARALKSLRYEYEDTELRGVWAQRLICEILADLGFESTVKAWQETASFY